MLEQTNKIPGNFSLDPQPFPNANWVMRRQYPGFPVYGLYAYNTSYRRHREGIAAVGWKYFRMGGKISEADINMFIEDKIEASLSPAAGPNRNSFSSDEQFLEVAVHRALYNMELWEKYIKYAHIWNEPNFKYLIPGLTAGKMDDLQRRRANLYGQLLLRVSNVIREQWPDVQILGFDIGRAGPNSSQFIEEVYRKHPNIHDAYDILATHPGVDPAPPETNNVKKWGSYSMAGNTQDIRNIVRKQPRTHHRHSKDIWFTESGWSITYENGGLYKAINGREVGLLLQAAYHCRYYAIAMRLGIDRVSPFFVEDTDGINGGFFHTKTGEWRPSAFAVQNMIRLMPNPKLIEVIHDGPDLFAYKFQPNVLEPITPITMYWNVTGIREINLASPALQTDMLGNIQESKIALIGPYPTYVQ